MTADQIMVFLELAIVLLLLFEVGIMCASVYIQVDDVYGVTQLKKHSKRKLRRAYKRFIKTSFKYLKGHKHAKQSS